MAPNTYFLAAKYKKNILSFLFVVLRDEFRLEPQNLRVAQGDIALLECAGPKGTPEPLISWKKNGQKFEIEHSKRIRIVDGGNLAIQDTRQSDEGQYQCVAKNAAGMRESKMAFLKIHGKVSRSCDVFARELFLLYSLSLLLLHGVVKPFMIRGPHDQTVIEGSSVTFQCRVGGDPTPDM